MAPSLAGDEEQLRALFEATKGPSEILKRRQDCVRRLGPPPLASSSAEADAEAAALRSIKRRGLTPRSAIDA